ncbi:MAG: PaaI family thioesterase [Kineosporiaceae bacterium]
MTAGTLMERMGIELLEIGAERTVARMPVAGNTQPYGLLHGGASAALAETVGSFAAQLHAGDGRAAVGIDLSATHHRAVRAGTVTAVATALHRGGTVATYGIEVRDDAGRLVCTARLTCVVRDSPPAG